ncbi:hypothetical protein HPP92_005922 [Vanilla planifolia]|uniref:Carbonic anhydrase n=1 Tax=Vanilla planifolia TaxID=51239 RepID=A0A835RZR5_VANPL|nr:hypothetical protein HPP92_006205 [Vanilla planifolia]KAG0494928.1 hypothetical protein HPP92_005922 [Vanilla planifolia]
MRKIAILFPFVLLLILVCSPAATSQEVEDEHEFSYDPDSSNGPEKWGEIRPEWAKCGTGQLQSPIDLNNKRVEVVYGLDELRRAYRPAEAVLKNRGHDIMLRWEGNAGGLWINGSEYNLRQLHWHSPSEHTIDGRSYALELHMVHESANQELAVVGILYIVGRPDSFLAELESYIKELKDQSEAEVNVGIQDPWQVKWGSRKYYRYMGSLTTPPCTEGVKWTIIKKVRTVSREQVKLLREAVHDHFEENARPVQPTNNRDVYLYRPLKLPYV